MLSNLYSASIRKKTIWFTYVLYGHFHAKLSYYSLKTMSSLIDLSTPRLIPPIAPCDSVSFIVYLFHVYAPSPTIHTCIWETNFVAELIKSSISFYLLTHNAKCFIANNKQTILLWAPGTKSSINKCVILLLQNYRVHFPNKDLDTRRLQ